MSGKSPPAGQLVNTLRQISCTLIASADCATPVLLALSPPVTLLADQLQTMGQVMASPRAKQAKYPGQRLLFQQALAWAV